MNTIIKMNHLTWSQLNAHRSCLCVFVLVGVIGLNVRASSFFMVDQEFKPAASSGISLYAKKNEPIGQEFMPTLRTLNRVEIYLKNIGEDRGDQAMMIVNIRYRKITGKVLGTSEPTFVNPGVEGPVEFIFKDPLTLKKEMMCVIELVHISGGEVVWNGSAAGGYAEGRLIYNGSPSENGDLWFRVGSSK